MGKKNIIFKHNKITKVELFILGSLSILSLLSGYFFKDIFSGLGSNYFNVVLILPSY
jgi:hypothetical protein